MTNVDFATPDDAETAFYAAFARCDLKSIMAVWLEDELIVCIHPMGPRLQGRRLVEEGWRQVLANSPPMRFEIGAPLVRAASGITVHSLFEEIDFGENYAEHSRVIATNVYAETEHGWRMVEHHGSPAVIVVPATAATSGAVH